MEPMETIVLNNFGVFVFEVFVFEVLAFKVFVFEVFVFEVLGLRFRGLSFPNTRFTAGSKTDAKIKTKKGLTKNKHERQRGLNQRSMFGTPS